MRLTKLFLLDFLIFPCVQAADAPFGKKDLKKTKELFAGTPYLRIDLPFRYGTSAWTSYVDALVEVSPTGSNVGGSFESGPGYWTSEGAFLGFGPDDPMKYTEIGMDRDKIWISLDGLVPKETAAIIAWIHGL